MVLLRHKSFRLLKRLRNVPSFGKHLPLVSPPSRFRPLSSDTEQPPIEDPGHYDIIIPDEPYVWGTSHIISRSVPSHIPRPPYVDITSPKSPEHFREGYSGDGRIQLGSKEETRLRKAARLARQVLRFASTLVGVSNFGVSICELSILTRFLPCAFL